MYVASYTNGFYNSEKNNQITYNMLFGDLRNENTAEEGP